MRSLGKAQDAGGGFWFDGLGEMLKAIPKILRYSFIVIVLLTNQKDYEHFVNVRVLG